MTSYTYLEILLQWYVYAILGIACKILLNSNSNSNNKYKDFILLSVTLCLIFTIFSPFLYYFDLFPKYIR